MVGVMVGVAVTVGVGVVVAVGVGVVVAVAVGVAVGVGVVVGVAVGVAVGCFMNKQQIKAELRRSACEDIYPIWDCGLSAFNKVVRWKQTGEFLFEEEAENVRIFFLLVAEAII